ncbi:hypothetical protein [Prevotella sp. 10(H)]|uniref:hypothetical protein n=1 Tax=Prevotella sp. 10(H) TaxID=1158294 RepID=UPI0004A755FD|nr:hypothetical protein [Prevotella sp. 10(H)]
MNKALLLLASVMFLFASCADEKLEEDDGDRIIWDFINYSVIFKVVDQSGHDLLNPETEENILDNDIVVKYDGKEFNRKTPKYNMPDPLDLRTYQLEEGSNALFFGEFSPESNYRDEKFTIEWGDGTQTDIKFDLYITWNEKRTDPSVHKIIYVDGKRYSDESFVVTITK